MLYEGVLLSHHQVHMILPTAMQPSLASAYWRVAASEEQIINIQM